MAIKKLNDVSSVSGGFRNYQEPKGFTRVEMKDTSTPMEWGAMRSVDLIKETNHIDNVKYVPADVRKVMANASNVIPELKEKLDQRGQWN